MPKEPVEARLLGARQASNVLPASAGPPVQHFPFNDLPQPRLLLIFQPKAPRQTLSCHKQAWLSPVLQGYDTYRNSMQGQLATKILAHRAAITCAAGLGTAGRSGRCILCCDTAVRSGKSVHYALGWARC